jgi:hypothetical protein
MIDHVAIESVQAGGRRASSEIHKLTNSVCNKDKLSQHWKESVNVLLMVRLIKLTVGNAYYIHHTYVKVEGLI